MLLLILFLFENLDLPAMVVIYAIEKKSLCFFANGYSPKKM